MKLLKFKFNLKLCLSIFALFTVINSISNLKFERLLKNDPRVCFATGINKNLSHVFEYFKLLDKHYKSKSKIDCNSSVSCKKAAESLKSVKTIKYVLNDIYKILFFDKNFKLKFEDKKFSKDIENKEKTTHTNNIFIRYCYLIKLIENSKENVFYLYSTRMYMYMNWISKSNNFKEIVLEKFKESKDNNINELKKFNCLVDKFILVIKIATSYIYKYSTQIVKDKKTIYRGVRLNKDDPILNIQTDSKKSNILVSPNPLSFSYDKSIAEEFSKLTNYTTNKVSVIFEIKDTKNCLGKNLDNQYLTNNINEKEYLLKPFSHLKIVCISGKKDRKLIVLKCLNDNKKINIIKNIHLMK